MSTDQFADWEGLEIPQGTSGDFRFGPLSLWITRYPQEWALFYRRDDDLLSNRTCSFTPRDTPTTEETTDRDALRVVSSGPSNAIALQPLLADRPIVGRPEKPFHVLPGAEITLYISSPMWLTVQVGAPRQRILDLPSHPLSDTWFGSTTTLGELCYALKANVRLDLDNLPNIQHRAITELKLENTSSEVVRLERLKLPIPNLTLYVDEDGRFWSQSVRFKLTHGGLSAEVDLGKGPPDVAPKPQLVAEPRQRSQRNILIRARDALFI